MLMTVLICETIKGFRNKLIKWKDAFERTGLKANLQKTEVMVSGDTTKYGMPKSKVDPCGVCKGKLSFVCTMW